jgi:hypothetical protein
LELLTTQLRLACDRRHEKLTALKLFELLRLMKVLVTVHSRASNAKLLLSECSR